MRPSIIGNITGLARSPVRLSKDRQTDRGSYFSDDSEFIIRAVETSILQRRC